MLCLTPPETFPLSSQQRCQAVQCFLQSQQGTRGSHSAWWRPSNPTLPGGPALHPASGHLPCHACCSPAWKLLPSTVLVLQASLQRPLPPGPHPSGSARSTIPLPGRVLTVNSEGLLLTPELGGLGDLQSEDGWTEPFTLSRQLPSSPCQWSARSLKTIKPTRRLRAFRTGTPLARHLQPRALLRPAASQGKPEGTGGGDPHPLPPCCWGACPTLPHPLPLVALHSQGVTS